MQSVTLTILHPSQFYIPIRVVSCGRKRYLKYCALLPVAIILLDSSMRYDTCGRHWRGDGPRRAARFQALFRRSELRSAPEEVPGAVASMKGNVNDAEAEGE